jgi:hypothetical protein
MAIWFFSPNSLPAAAITDPWLFVPAMRGLYFYVDVSVGAYRDLTAERLN